MAPKFGTSGLRGLVTELTPELVAAHVRAFIASCPVGQGIYVGYDLRPSSPQIADVVTQAAAGAGVSVRNCGAVPTPALALAAMGAGAAAVMVTGSHIPADRNGLKFYTPQGEITKDHEVAIRAALSDPAPDAPGGVITTDSEAGAAYVARYTQAFGSNALAGLRVGVYSHSTVGRDIIHDIVKALGAKTVDLGRSETFIPVDTEAVAPEVRAQLNAWAELQTLFSILSMDGDGDRPLLTDAAGHVVPGDVLGQITGTFLNAEVAVTPVSSNTGAEAVFPQVTRTRIGSPYVIAGMEKAGGAVVGYEANGGFLLGFASHGLDPLTTRDAMLPMVATLIAARGQGVAATVAAQPARFTAADRLQEVPTEASQALIAGFEADRAKLDAFLATLGGQAAGVNRTDGLRVTLADGRIVHIRPSGNAPECRFYAEAETPEKARKILEQGLISLRNALT